MPHASRWVNMLCETFFLIGTLHNYDSFPPPFKEATSKQSSVEHFTDNVTLIPDINFYCTVYHIVQ